VADFFCGAGGFSEGFKLAGFEISFAVDKWGPAVVTHHANHSNAKTIQDDVIRISKLPNDKFHNLVPDTEVIIGSPPCTFFSNSNKSGKADKSMGIQLIEAYLRIVARKSIKKDSILKYWILENVPNVFSYIKEEYTFYELGLDREGSLRVKYPSSKVYNAKYFDVASNRKRYFCGNFPEPYEIIKHDNKVKTIQDIFDYIHKPNNNLEEVIQDPNYDFKMTSKDITDHHYIMEVADFEWKKAKRQKQDKGYMGKMSFPENFNRPSRTIMATMSCSSRESMIYPHIPEEERYRLPTVREIASLMSYPIDYRFYGKSKSIKYKLVGNSVPPKMSFAIAKEIALKNNLTIPKKYEPIKFENIKEDFTNLNLNVFHLNEEREKRPNAKFKYHVPYLIIDTFRVELTNYNSDFENLSFKWDVEIHKSQGKSAKKLTPVIDSSIVNKKHRTDIENLIKLLCDRMHDENTFQYNYRQTDLRRKNENLFGPYELLEEIKKFIDNNLNNKSYEKNIYLKKENIKIPYITIISYYILKECIKNI
jgi:DNA (cytosine-5)-methyltransferase 1